MTCLSKIIDMSNENDYQQEFYPPTDEDIEAYREAEMSEVNFIFDETKKLAIFETSKMERLDFAKTVLHAIDAGIVDPLKIHLQIKAMEDLINTLTCTDEKKNKNFAIAAAYKHNVVGAAERNGKKFNLYNAAFSVTEVGTKWDYSVCQDETYNALVEQKAKLDARIKEREKFLQNVPESGVADGESGNMVYRANKTSTTSVSVSLK